MNKNTINFYIGTLLTLISKFITIPIGILVAKIIGTEGYGFYAIAAIAAQFMSYGNLGIFNGLNRELPIIKGLGSKTEESKIYDAVFSFTICSTIATSILLIILTEFFSIVPDLDDTSIILFIILIYISGNLESFFYNSIKGENQLKLWSIYVSIRPILDSITSLIFVLMMGYIGFIISIAVSKIISTLVLFNYYSGRKPRFRLTKNITVLLTTGIPIMLSNLSKNLLVKGPVLLTSAFLPVKEIGLIAFGITNLSFEEKVPASHIYALSHRNEFARIKKNSPKLEPYVNFYISSNNFQYHLLINGLLGGLLSIFYFIITSFYLNEFQSIQLYLTYITTFYLATSISFFLMQLLDIMKYLYTKICIILSSTAFFLILIIFQIDNLNTEKIIISYMFSSLFMLFIVYSFLFYHAKSFDVLSSFMKSFLTCAIYYFALNYSFKALNTIDTSIGIISIEFIYTFIISIAIFILSYLIGLLLIFSSSVLSFINSQTLYNMFKK